MAFNGQILAAVQLALDDDRLANIHDVPLHAVTRLRARTKSSRRHRRGGVRGSRWLSARGADRFIAFPHCHPPPVMFWALGSLPLVSAGTSSLASIWNPSEVV